MKSLVLIFALISAPLASAQMSVQENDSNRLTVMGRTVNFNFFSLANTEVDKMNDEGGRLSTYNYLTMSSWVASNYRFSLRVPFTYSTAGTDRFNDGRMNESETALQDIILELQNYNLAYLPFDFEVYWSGRTYLPTGKHSKDSGTLARFRNEFILSKRMARKVELEYSNQFSYYAQSRATTRISFQDELGYDVTVNSATRRFDLDQRLSLWYILGPSSGLSWQFSDNQSQRNRSRELNRPQRGERERSTGPAIRFPITNNANFIFAYQDVVDADANEHELGQFQARNAEFTLLSFVRF